MKPVLLFLVASLAGCAIFSGKPRSAERGVTYTCNYGPDLTILYTGGAARIQSADGEVTLRERRSASGFRYESATHSLQVSGDDISYKDRQMAPRQCHKVK